MNKFHTPVLSTEVVSFFNPQPGARYIDATFGGGGHSKLILDRGSLVLGIDQDHQAITRARQLYTQPNLTLECGNFSSLSAIAVKHHFTPVAGIFFDLGVSSWQLDEPERGFSFTRQAPLDMRMDQTLQVTAADLVAALGKKELTKLFTLYGDERAATKIADLIIKNRAIKPITTTTQLAELISSMHPHTFRPKIHPATKVFQALRIAVNDELNSLKSALPQTLDLLKPNGKLAIISFHSGEDAIVKAFFKDQAAAGHLTLVTKKPLGPGTQELSANPRSRSAKLRLATKP